VMERARNRARADQSSDPVIEARHLDPDGEPANAARRSTPPGQAFPRGVRDKWTQLGNQRDDLEALEKEIIEEALVACGGVVLRVARELSVSRSGLISRMATLEINPNDFKPKSG
ncbi:MAG: helix-turn-helix domain-containing protein, partial [Polyangiales bacterium]